MAPFYPKPENALKRAEELIAVGQNAAALTLLHELIMSKRARTTQLNALEPIVLKFVELCVNLRKGKTAKEGLHQFKNISQNITVSSIEVVIKRFIELSDQKVIEAQAKAERLTLDAIDDLEASETPESIIMSTVSGDDSKDRTDREVVTPWLKFLWEAYRTALDILRNNARLELLYQAVAIKAFGFCQKYARKTELRRLCELLRQHLTTAAKYSHQANSINLNDPETLQRHLETRFQQLNVSAELELWQEAFKSIEDIHNLLATSKKPPKPHMMANYYEKLARIFATGENYLFHAAAWNKYYQHLRQNRSVSEEEHQKLASIVLLSALSIPIISGSREEDTKPKTIRLTSLLRVARAPTREALLREALNKNVLRWVRPELRDLYDILEVQFHPLVICQKIEPIIKLLSDHTELSKYVKPLYQVVLTRLLQQLSKVYTTIKIDSVVKLASLNTEHSYDAHTIEKFVMAGCQKGELNIRINHQTRTITFETDVFGSSASAQLQNLPSEQMRSQMTVLAKRLHTAVCMVDPDLVEAKRKEREEAVRAAAKVLEEEQKKAAMRRLLIEKKKEIREFEQVKREREAEKLRQLQFVKEQEAEQARLKAEQEKREAARMEDTRKKIEAENAKRMLGQLKLDLERQGKTLDINEEEVNELKVLEEQAKKIQQEKIEQQNKLKTIAKKMDHTERAYRKEEILMLSKDYEDQKKIDKAYHSNLHGQQVEAARIAHAKAMEMKKRMQRMLGDYEKVRLDFEGKRTEEFAALQAEAAEKIQRAKAARIAEVRAKEAARLLAERKAEEDRIRREEEARIEAERKAREAEEKAAFLAAKKAKDEEERKKLDESARKQREREEEIERKRAEREREQRSGAGVSGGRRDEDPWKKSSELWRSSPRAPVAAAAASGGGESGSSSGGGKYVPPSKRAGDAPEGSWRNSPSAPSAPAASSSSGKYVPPSQRAAAGREPDAYGRRDEGRRDTYERPAPASSTQIGESKWRAKTVVEKREEEDGFTSVARKGRY
ncbi:hypothetical protein BJ742DRAFT_787141 [Cladochytrium replicatum]|nr:hypothetical protein BJ742DRAFT_787141 [Cladochytrium replicatum]